MKTKLVSLALLIFAFCLLTPSVSANAQINHDKQTSTDTESFTVTQDLPPENYPYTKMQIILSSTSTLSVMYNQVTDAKGNIHINGKASVRGTMHAEAWVYDDIRQLWILGQRQMQSSKMFLSLNVLTLDSETQNSQEIRVLANRMKTSALDLDTGQTITVDVLIIEHVMIKLNNGELQFEKSWEILHN